MSKEVISVELYGGKGIFNKKETPLEAEIVSCDKAQSCSFYQEGTCLSVSRYFSPSCRFSTTERIKGYTSRAKKYNEFKSKWKEHEAYGKIKNAAKKLGKVEDVIIFPYAHILITIEDGKAIINGPQFFGGSPYSYIPIEYFTVETIYRIVKFKPQALMGGEISVFKKEIVPKFLADLHDLMPSLYNDFTSSYPEYQTEINYVGRQAYLHTINPSTVQYTSSSYPQFNSTWEWNGEHLTYVDGYVSSFNIANKTEIVNIVLKPNEDTVITITSNDQVNSKTLFKD